MNENDYFFTKLTICAIVLFLLFQYFNFRSNSKITNIIGVSQNQSSFVDRTGAKKIIYNEIPLHLKSGDLIKSGQGETLKLKLWGLELLLFPFSDIELKEIPEFPLIFAEKIIEVYGYEGTLCVKKDGAEALVYEDEFVIAGSVTTIFFINKTSEYTEIISLEGVVDVEAKQRRGWKGKADEVKKVIVHRNRDPELKAIDRKEKSELIKKGGYEYFFKNNFMKKNLLLNIFSELMFEKSVLKQYMRTFEMAQLAYFYEEGEVFANSLNELKEKFNSLTIPKSMNVHIYTLGNGYKIEIGLRDYVYIREFDGDKRFERR